IDISAYEQQQLFLEGTGSMVLDRENKIAYACLSPRTDIQVLNDWCNKAGFRPVAFTSVDSKGDPIYHTNVMMCIADRFAVICLDSIPNGAEKRNVIETLQDTKKEIIEISFYQMNHFAGNMLQVQNTKGDRFLVMSSQAYNSLTSEQIKRIENYNPILHSDITTIETNGGGSDRCMMAEVFLAEK
ncbi:MAG: amidinotransferase, partial [Chitinophagaceae bacterium]|nr:amidinotransferase [Chitinophagaceae bacterium]